MRARRCVRAHTHRLHVWQVTRCMEHGSCLFEHGFCLFEHEFYFFEHEFLEYNEFTMRMCIFILPQMAQMDTDFFTKTFKNTVYIFRAHGLLKIQTKP